MGAYSLNPFNEEAARVWYILFLLSIKNLYAYCFQVQLLSEQMEQSPATFSQLAILYA